MSKVSYTATFTVEIFVRPVFIDISSMRCCGITAYVAKLSLIAPRFILFYRWYYVFIVYAVSRAVRTLVNSSPTSAFINVAVI